MIKNRFIVRELIIFPFDILNCDLWSTVIYNSSDND